MKESDELISAFVLDGRGGGKTLDWAGVESWSARDGVLWIHLNREGTRTRAWLDNHSGLEEWARDAMVAEETRPRATEVGDALLVILRGVNLNPEADPEDMVSIRVWIDGSRVISTRKRQLMAAADVRDALTRGAGPTDAAGLLVTLAENLVERMAPTIEQINDRVDDVEDQILSTSGFELRSVLAGIRRQAISLRRYIGPQREAMSRLQNAPVSWLKEPHRLCLREINDRITRHVEDLDAARERAAVTQEELSGRLAEQMNGTMYRLSVVATIFLPLGLLTGLLGVNVGGIPGSDAPWAFAMFSAGLLAIAVGEILYFRRKRLL